ncbi:unnamed protein product [Bursaphelenchus okinawaensis]|uniref:Uncharacterized protein n=1 Tax=Bursaphelenchus okinawaensis TaxID=465554 RepID=A0A811L155_9BILA|nr:unnamed protein product [Bursaphelenchus okinawaensis]CAG9114869.1 unnamed protein product [Bursaphelenchus okinawaensis]
MKLTSILILFFIETSGAQALRCLTCEGSQCSYTGPLISEECPPAVHLCYALSNDNGDLYQFGCSYTDCSRIRVHHIFNKCDVCDTNDCLPLHLSQRRGGAVGSGGSLNYNRGGSGTGGSVGGYGNVGSIGSGGSVGYGNGQGIGTGGAVGAYGNSGGIGSGVGYGNGGRRGDIGTGGSIHGGGRSGAIGTGVRVALS